MLFLKENPKYLNSCFLTEFQGREGRHQGNDKVSETHRHLMFEILIREGRWRKSTTKIGRGESQTKGGGNSNRTRKPQSPKPLSLAMVQLKPVLFIDPPSRQHQDRMFTSHNLLGAEIYIISHPITMDELTQQSHIAVKQEKGTTDPCNTPVGAEPRISSPQSSLTGIGPRISPTYAFHP